MKVKLFEEKVEALLVSSWPAGPPGFGKCILTTLSKMSQLGLKATCLRTEEKSQVAGAKEAKQSASAPLLTKFSCQCWETLFPVQCVL